MDDVAEGGDEVHQRQIKIFYDKYECVKRIHLRKTFPEGFLFAARRATQLNDYRFTITMDEYVRGKLMPIDIITK